MNDVRERMDRNLAFELIRVTEAAALDAARWMGRGNREAADQAAVDAMRHALHWVDTARGFIDIDATVAENLRNVARAKRLRVEDLTVVVLDRDRHSQLIAEIRETGART